MALIKLAPLISMIRGSIGGATFTRTGSGPSVRAKAQPTSFPGSRTLFDFPGFNTAPNFRRAGYSQMAYTWSVTLTQAQRTAWDDLAVQTRLLNRLGEPKQATGRGLYFRTNALALLQGRNQVIVAPARAVAQLPLFTWTWNVVSDTFTITTALNSLPAGTDAYIWVSPLARASRRQWSHPFYFAGKFSVAAPPPTLTSPPDGLGWVPSSLYFARMRTFQQDGALSHPGIYRLESGL